MPSTVPFKDLSLSFAKNKVTDDLLVKKEDAAVKQAILNLLLTQKGERLYDAEYGSDLKSHLFEPLDFGTAAVIRDEIYSVITSYESRIEIKNLTVDTNFEDNGYDIELEYTIRGRSDLQTNIEFFLESSR